MESGKSVREVHFKLGLTACCILFFELLLIRWVSTEVNIFAYLQNSVLVVCFLGLGMGLLYPKTGKATITPAIFSLALITIFLSVEFTREKAGFISQALSIFHDFVIWDHWVQKGSIEELVLAFFGACAALMVLSGIVWGVMVPFGQSLGGFFEQSPSTIVAYSYDIGGSLIGIWIYTLLGYFALPPAAWVVTGALLLLPLCEKKIWIVLGCLPLLTHFGYLDAEKSVNWTPYQKIQFSAAHDEPGEYLVTTNNSGYQQIQNNSPSLHKGELDALALSQYDLAARLHPNPKRVLIGGVGTGNDLAGAVRQVGDAQIVGVEIDPLIAELGKEYHPEKPYQNPNVEVIIEDARAAFHSLEKGTFDLIITGLLDAHTTPNLSNARLDNFFYTKESLQAASELLSPDGVMVISFAPQRPYIAERLRRTLDQIFETPTTVFQILESKFGWGGVLFINGNQESLAKTFEQNPDVKDYIDRFTAPADPSVQVEPTSDDWPYLYIEYPMIPSLFYLLGAIILILWGLTSYGFNKKLVFPPLQERETLHFFALGLGFILLQVFVITKASLLFGSTWIVNSVVISGMMITILIANFLIYKKIIPPLMVVAIAMVGVCIGMAVLSFKPILSFDLLPRLIIGIVISGIPTILSGILFGTAFSVAKKPSHALGANLFGSLVGAVVQSVVFLLGINSLALIGGSAYVVSLLTLPKRSS